MLRIDIPGFGELSIKNILLDLNGTIAFDGKIVNGLVKILKTLSKVFDIYIITADTFGFARDQIADLPCHLEIISKEDQTESKLQFASKLGLISTICIGNGNNDSLMVKKAIIGIAILDNEGAATKTVFNADIVCKSIFDALGLLTNEKRLIATLRQ